jgi:pimeloyl-ACP methyl ester carboxylesterase
VVLAMASTRSHDDHLVWKRATVERRTALYGVAGERGGIPVVFLHGWGLGQHAYKRALKRLVKLGCRVWAPALPGFGGTADLPARRFSMAGYAEWVDGFMTAVKIDEPVFLVGHSFGGGVAIQTSHDYPDRVRSLVLVNSIGGSAWRADGSLVKSMAERPLWDWGIHFPADILPLRQIRNVLPVILEDAVPNLVRNPRAMWRVAGLARRANLVRELEHLKERGMPVTVLWGGKDEIVPKASFDALCLALGQEGEVLEGNHSWLLADPDAFGEVMTNVVAVADAARSFDSLDGGKSRAADADVAAPAGDAGGVEDGEQGQGVLARRAQRLADG